MSTIDPAQLKSFIDSLGGDAAETAKNMGTELFETVKNAVEEERKKKIVGLITEISKYTEGHVKKLRFLRKEARKSEDEITALKDLATKLLAGDPEAWEDIDKKMGQHLDTYGECGPYIPSASNAGK